MWKPGFLLSAALTMGLGAAGVARADILAGRIGATGTTELNVVTIFGDAMNGDTAPLALLGGTATTMNTASRLVYDPAEHTILIADFYGQQVLVFDAAARLNTAPLRSFSNAILGQVREAVPISAHNEYAVINSSSISYFPRTASGGVFALRRSNYLPSLINNLSGLIYVPNTDEVAIGDYADLGGGLSEGEVLFFARLDSGDVVPTRRIAGALTQLGDGVSGLARDPQSGEIYVLAYQVVAAETIHRLLTFAANADGNIAPLRSIAGPATLMDNSYNLSFYAFRNELLVTSAANSGGIPRILGFPRTADGDVAPTRNIGGSSTGVVPGNGWFGVVGVPLELVFASGFE